MKTLLLAIFLVLALLVLPSLFAPDGIASLVLSYPLAPGSIAVYTWAPMHDFWPFVLAILANVLFYWLVLKLAHRACRSLRRPAAARDRPPV